MRTRLYPRLRMALALATAAAGYAVFFHTPVLAASEPKGVAVAAENLFVLPAPAVHKVELIDQLSVKNTTASVQSLNVALPNGASDVTVNGTAATGEVFSNQQVMLNRALPAGKTTSVTLTWTLPLSSQQDAQFTLHANYPVYTANVYMPIGNNALSAENLLTTTQTVTVSGTKFREFTRLGIPAGDDWTMSVQMLPSASAAPTTGGLNVIGSHPGSTGSSFEAIANLMIIALILVIGLLSIRATQWGQGQKRKSAEEALLDGLVALHRQYELGMLDEPEFARRDSQMKDRLKMLRRRASNFAEPSSGVQIF